MPVLRMPADTSLGDTLGNLGKSFTQNFNPLARMQAYQLQQRMFLEQEQLRETQRKNAAQLDAVRHFARFVPPDYLPMIATMIYQGAPWEQITRQVALHSGKLIDKNDDVSLAHNIEWMRQIDPTYSYEKDGPPVGGAVTAKALNDWKAAQAGATTGAQKQAEADVQAKTRAGYSSRYMNVDTPEARANNLKVYQEEYGKLPDDGLTPPVTPIFQQIHDAEVLVRNQQMKYGDVMGSTEAKADLAKGLVDDPTGGHDPGNRVILTAITGTTPDPNTIAPAGPQTRALAEQQRNQIELEKAAAVKRGELIGKGGPSATETTLPSATLPPAPGQPPVPAPTPSAPGQPPAPAPAPTPVVSGRPLANNPDMVINGYRVTAVPRTSGPMIGAVPGAGDAAQKLTETYYKSLSDVYAAGGEPVAKLRDTVSQLQNLSNIAQTNGIYGQWTTAMRAQAKALGFGDITNAQQAQTAMDNLLKTLIPELKSDYNLSRVAQPEIVLLGKVTGSADLTQPELANILANLRTGTDLSEALRSQAARALGLSSDQTPYDYPDYAKFENDSFNKYSQVAEQNRANFGAIGARLDNRKPPVQTPVQTPPDQSAPPVQTPPGPVQQQGAGNPILDFFGGLGHIFGGGNPPATTPPDSRELVPGKDF